MKLLSKMLCAALLGVGVVAGAAAQGYPTRPVQVMIGFPAGGSGDIVARLVMQKMTDLTGNPFLIENRTGAGGNLAFSATASAKPDGYTLLFSTPGIAINPSLYKKVNFTLEDFTPIALIGEAPLVLLANPTLSIKTVADLVAAGKAKPDAIRFASSGNGSSSHLAMDVLRHMSGMSYMHIPYRGGGPALVDVISGQVDVTMLPISETLSYIREGRVVALGQSGKTRSPIAPNIPTIEEAGIKGYFSTTWYMVLGPANLPANVIDYVQGNLSKVLKMPELQEKLQAVGVSIINGDSADAKAFLYAEYARWRELIKASDTVIE